MIGKTNAISGVSAPVPKIKTVSGSVISISDALAMPAVSLITDINAVQSGSGDPSPSNVRPISGWSAVKVTRTGKNLLPSDTYMSGNGRTLAFGQAVTTTTYTILLKSGVTYTLTVVPPDSTVSYRLYVKNANGPTPVDDYAIGTHSATFSVADSGLYSVYAYTANGNVFPSKDYFSSFQLETGSTATAYEPYNGDTYTIDLDGTRYGGSLDVTTGVLTVDRVKRVLNDASKWAAYTGTVDFYYNVEFGDRKTFSDSYTGLSCSYIQINSQTSNTNTGRWRGAGSPYFGIKSNALTLEQIQADAIAGKIEICYELATPQTVQLSPTTVQMLLGNNTLWADSGDSELQYWARR